LIADCRFDPRRKERGSFEGSIDNRKLTIGNARDPLNLMRLAPSKGETAVATVPSF
jgi:hypothetical protein